jgi:hypothetical protein
MHSWKKKLGSGMILVHDATSAMARQRRYWDALMSPDAPDDTIGYDRRKIQFPIGISETRFEPSEGYAGLQLADILAGVVAECMANKMVPEEDRAPSFEIYGIISTGGISLDTFGQKPSSRLMN